MLLRTQERKVKNEREISERRKTKIKGSRQATNREEQNVNIAQTQIRLMLRACIWRT